MLRFISSWRSLFLFARYMSKLLLISLFFDSVRRTYVAYAFNSLAERSRTNLSNSASEYLLDHDENWLLMRTHGEVDKFLYYTYACAESNV